MPSRNCAAGSAAPPAGSPGGRCHWADWPQAALGSALGAHATLWIAAIGGCLSGLWLYFSPLRHMRDMPIEKFQPASSPT